MFQPPIAIAFWNGGCTPGRHSCDADGRTPRSCGDDGLRDEPSCLVECVGDGICTGECFDDEHRCDPETRRPQVCSPDGAWQNAAACTGADVCVTATGECGAGARPEEQKIAARAFERRTTLWR